MTDNKYLKTMFGISIPLYLFCSFIAWDFNPGNWDMMGRYAFILVYFILMLFAYFTERK